jgi:hypothetical protein
MIVVHVVALLVLSCSYWTVKVQADYVVINSNGIIKTGKGMLLNQMKNTTQKEDLIVDITPHTYSFASLATSLPDDYSIAVDFIIPYVATKVLEFLETVGNPTIISLSYSWSGYYVPSIGDGTDNSNFNLFLIFDLVEFTIPWEDPYLPSSDELFQVMVESITTDEFLPSFVSYTAGTIFDTVSKVQLEAGQLYTPGPTISASPTTQYPTPSMTQYPTPLTTPYPTTTLAPYTTQYPTIFIIPVVGITVEPFILSYASSGKREPTETEYLEALYRTAEYLTFSLREYLLYQKEKTTTSNTKNNQMKKNNTATTETTSNTNTNTTATKDHETELPYVSIEMGSYQYDPSSYFDIQIYCDFATFVFSSSMDILPTEEMLNEFMMNTINDPLYVSYLLISLSDSPFLSVTEALWSPNIDVLEPTPFPTSSYITEHPIRRSERRPSPNRRTRKTGQKQ